MKNLIFVFLLLSYSCQASLNNDHELNRIFSKEEVKFFNEILVYFDNFIASEYKTDNISNSYDAFCESLKGSLTVDNINDSIYIDTNSLKRFSLNLRENPFFYELWKFEELFNYDTKEIIRKEVNLNLSGKAIKLLKLLQEKYEFYDVYYDLLIEIGGLSPSIYGGYHFAHEKLNFDDPKVRLWTGIHYLTLKMSYIDVPKRAD